jgi:hypothetical protein
MNGLMLVQLGVILMTCKFKHICKLYNTGAHTCEIEPDDYCGKYRYLKILVTIWILVILLAVVILTLAITLGAI